MGGFVQQYEIGRRRLDFAHLELKLNVEADGKEYHSGLNKEKDIQRDIWLKMQGWTVIRFTGSRIVREVDKCIQEISEMVRTLNSMGAQSH